MKEIIFYHPYSLVKNPSKGSELRPKKMKEAYENLGFKVRLVTGNSSKRKQAIKKIKKEIKQGKKFEFLYGESSNLPVPLADSHHLPIRPFLDYNFFRMLNRLEIPIGIFYRDLFWMVKELRWRHGFLKNVPRQLFHWIEWFGLKSTIDHLFLPSDSMARYLPTEWPKEKRSALLPGCTLIKTDCGNIEKPGKDKLKLFYVGGIEPKLYNVEPLLKVVSEVDGVSLVMCCRENHWAKYSSYYQNFDLSDVKIVHADSTEIGKYYQQADLIMCLWPPEGYINVTIPIKIIEAIGYHVPLVLLKGSESASVVDKDDVGWTVDSLSEAKRLLEELKKDPKKIIRKKNHIAKVSEKHTWERRAEKAKKILTDLNPNL